MNLYQLLHESIKKKKNFGQKRKKNIDNYNDMIKFKNNTAVEHLKKATLFPKYSGIF